MANILKDDINLNKIVFVCKRDGNRRTLVPRYTQQQRVHTSTEYISIEHILSAAQY